MLEAQCGSRAVGRKATGPAVASTDIAVVSYPGTAAPANKERGEGFKRSGTAMGYAYENACKTLHGHLGADSHDEKPHKANRGG